MVLEMIWNQSCSVTCQSWIYTPLKINMLNLKITQLAGKTSSKPPFVGFNKLIFWGVYRNHLRLLDDSTGSWYFTCPLIKEGDDPGYHCRFGDQHWARLLVESLLVTNLNHQPLHSTPPKKLTAGYPKNDSLEMEFFGIYVRFLECTST